MVYKLMVAERAELDFSSSDACFALCWSLLLSSDPYLSAGQEFSECPLLCIFVCSAMSNFVTPGDRLFCSMRNFPGSPGAGSFLSPGGSLILSDKLISSHFGGTLTTCESLTLNFPYSLPSVSHFVETVNVSKNIVSHKICRNRVWSKMVPTLTRKVCSGSSALTWAKKNLHNLIMACRYPKLGDNISKNEIISVL